MGNQLSALNSDFQSQNASIMQRVKGTQVDDIKKLFLTLTKDTNGLLKYEKQEEFFTSVIDMVAPQYKPEKREKLLKGWILQDKRSLSMSDIELQMKTFFVTNFSIRAIPLKSIVRGGVKTVVPTIIEISSPMSDSSVEKPKLAVSCVLDKSGSMSGNLIKFAIKAICKVIKHLGPGDIFNLVTYDNKIDVLIRNGDLENKDKLRDIVRGVRVGGSTNICDALVRGSDLVTYTSVPGDYIRRVFLFSDGHANCGEIQKSKGLSDLASSIKRESDISITTFGLGTNYSEEVMSGMANGSGGDYYYISKANEIPKTISKALHGLIDLFAVNAQLRIIGKNEGVVTKLGGEYAGSDVSLPIKIGDLNANDQKRVLFELEVSPKSGTERTEEVCSVTISYDKKNETSTNTETQSFNLSLTFTDNEMKYVNQKENSIVRVSQVIQQVTDIDLKIVGLIDRNQYEESIKEKEKAIQLLEECLPYDDNNNLPMIIARNKELLKSLKGKKNAAGTRKLFHKEAEKQSKQRKYEYYDLSDSSGSEEELIDDVLNDYDCDSDSDSCSF